MTEPAPREVVLGFTVRSAFVFWKLWFIEEWINFHTSQRLLFEFFLRDFQVHRKRSLNKGVPGFMGLCYKPPWVCGNCCLRPPVPLQYSSLPTLTQGWHKTVHPPIEFFFCYHRHVFCLNGEIIVKFVTVLMTDILPQSIVLSLLWMREGRQRKLKQVEREKKNVK